MRITQFMGGVHLYVRTRARADVPPFPYLGNGWSDCAEIRFVVRDPFAWRISKFNERIHVHVRTCTPLLRISGTAGRIALKLGGVRGPLAMRFTQNGISARAHV